MSKKANFPQGFRGWFRLSIRKPGSHWRRVVVTVETDDVAFSVAHAEVDDTKARSFVAHLKRGDRLQCASGFSRFEVRVVDKSPEPGCVWLAARDVIDPFFRSAFAKDPFAPRQPQLEKRRSGRSKSQTAN